MIVPKKLLNDGTKKVLQWWYWKSSLIMKLKTLHSDGTKKVPWLHWKSSQDGTSKLTKNTHFICQVLMCQKKKLKIDSTK